jgi:hypothetical protein
MSWGSLVHALDPVAWLASADWIPDPWQVEALESTSRKLLLNCSRQSGKSSTVAAAGLHTALFTPSALVLIVSPAERQSVETIRKVKDLMGRLPDRPEILAESQTQIEFVNRSRIVALPGTQSTIRGYSGVNLLILDEARWIEDGIIAAVTPMTSTVSGRIIGLSTPGLKAGWFWNQWTHGRNWHRIRATVHDCPRIDPEFVEDERHTMTPAQFGAEYECQFMDSDEAAWLSTALIDALIDPSVRPLWPGKTSNASRLSLPG